MCHGVDGRHTTPLDDYRDSCVGGQVDDSENDKDDCHIAFGPLVTNDTL